MQETDKEDVWKLISYLAQMWKRINKLNCYWEKTLATDVIVKIFNNICKKTNYDRNRSLCTLPKIQVQFQIRTFILIVYWAFNLQSYNLVY